MKKQIAVYSHLRQRGGLSSMCECCKCHKKAQGEIMQQRGRTSRARPRLILPQGWQEGAISHEGADSFVVQKVAEDIYMAFGFLCGDCHAEAITQFEQMSAEDRAALYEGAIIYFEEMAEKLDRVGDHGDKVVHESAEWLGYHNARRLLRILGRVISKSPPTHKEEVKTRPPTLRYLGTSDIGANPWNKS